MISFPRLVATTLTALALTTGFTVVATSAANAEPAPKLYSRVVPKGLVVAGGSATFELLTHNGLLAGPTNNAVDTSQAYPEDVTPVSAAGDGWTCNIMGQTVRCSRPGSGDDAIGPGEYFPPVNVRTNIGADASGAKEISSTVTAVGEEPSSTKSGFLVVPNVA